MGKLVIETARLHLATAVCAESTGLVGRIFLFDRLQLVLTGGRVGGIGPIDYHQLVLTGGLVGGLGGARVMTGIRQMYKRQS